MTVTKEFPYTILMNPIYCRFCEECGVKTEIFFSPSVKSETGKLIPIEVETKKNHDCPNREKWRQLESSKWSKPSKQEGQTTKFEKEVIRLLKENNKIQKENNQLMKALTILYVGTLFLEASKTEDNLLVTTFIIRVSANI